MAARGSESKNIITAKILETFAGSFIYDKNIIVPMVENGESLQIKIALTCAKTNIPHSNGKAEIPMTVATGMSNSVEVVEPTEEEKQRVVDLINKLGSI